MSAAISYAKKNLGPRAKPQIEVKLKDNQKDEFAPSYTSLDEIKGEVLITCSGDLAFEDIWITFEGAAKTYVEKIATTSPTNGKSEAFQNFLRLVQPMEPAAFPESRVLEAHKTYKFPFNFVVPPRLLPQSCTHPKPESFPEDAHLNLPPSLGDPLVASWGKSLMDDMCPDMSTIIYSIKCRMTSGRSSSGRHMTMAEASKKLRILPAVDEAPPLNVEGGDKDDFRLRKEKSIKRGVFRKKLGRLAAEAQQPKSLRLHSINSTEACPVTTMATVNVRFDPADEGSPPPRLNSLAAKLKVATFYSSVPMKELPTKSSDFHYSSVKGLFVDSVPLSSRCLAAIKWEGHNIGDPDSKALPPSYGYKGKKFYTAKVVVPIELPKGSKVFVPSFNSCLISRLYALDLSLSIEPPKASVMDPILHLKLPIQISCEPSPNIGAGMPSLRDVHASDDFFVPRSVAPPREEFLGRSNLPQISPALSTSPVSTTPMLSSTAAEEAPATNGVNTAANPTNQRISFSVPQRSSWAPGVIPQRAPQSVRLMGAQQRFQSLSFDDDEALQLAEGQDIQPNEEQPPEYSSLGGRWRERISTNVRQGQMSDAPAMNGRDIIRHGST
ncbi:uncharacterized protein KY384_001506 [Bacidia gigantensis]|uniref:uncharacterized protein n=1 Tax=Bacidia gigantensis TaxID=2732470 RepID=UPI001D04F79A|nr:uncharacterized protein KY384_001506 [Bacidia gigantensis]KAG8533765.1 hypothetical protein KY384_001506 [Bacidia gigantensis]